jgi:hypothetical protein
MNAWYTTSPARISPLRTGWPGSRNRRTASTTNGITYCPAMLGCPVAWEIIEGAKPQNAPPSAAADRLRKRRST